MAVGQLIISVYGGQEIQENFGCQFFHCLSCTLSAISNLEALYSLAHPLIRERSAPYVPLSFGGPETRTQWKSESVKDGPTDGPTNSPGKVIEMHLKVVKPFGIPKI